MGDQEVDRDLSLESLVERFGDQLLTRIRLMMGPGARAHAESGDFVQRAFAAILEEQRTAFRDERHFLRLATQIARHDILDDVRRDRERAFTALSDSVIPGDDERSDATPSGSVARRERADLLVEALEQLPPVHARVIELRDLEGLSFAAIGEELGRSKKAASLLHTRATTKLGAMLRRRGL